MGRRKKKSGRWGPTRKERDFNNARGMGEPSALFLLEGATLGWEGDELQISDKSDSH